MGNPLRPRGKAWGAKWALALVCGLAAVDGALAQYGRYGMYELPEDLTDVGVGWTPHSPFLVRPNTAMDYTNFGWTRYRERGGGFDWFPAFDEFGERWLTGAESMFSWTEDRSRAPDFGSDFRKNLGRHNNLVIAREQFGHTAIRLTVGDAIRTSFTSLTLDMSRFTGLRGDAVFGENHELTLLSSRPSDPTQRLRLQAQGRAVRDQGTLLGAGHWEGRFLEGALFLGGTFVNHHRFDSLQESGRYFEGTMPREMNPDTVMVRVTDDSPQSGARGAALYDSRARLTLRRNDGETWVVPGVRPVVVASGDARWEEDHWLVDGAAYVEEVVPMPDDAVGVQTRSTVAQDYRLGMRQVHRAVDRTSVQQRLRGTPLVTRSRSARGGPDLPQVVDFEHGLSSAMNVGGLNGTLAMGALNLEWEYARSSTRLQFPEEQIGTRSSYDGSAYYLRGVQDWWQLSLGGEWFSVSPRYNSYALDGGNYRLGNPQLLGTDDYITRAYSGNDFDFYFNESQPNPVRGGNDKRNVVFALVEDNDDDDQYEDQSQNDDPVTERTQSNESGVYPGWDLDQDGVPDYNRNRNSIPDYAEPFFKYWQEEQVFYWGGDANNNGVLDAFEDDSLPDYPYYKDERGTHLFANWLPPLRGLTFRVGRYRIEQIAGSGRSDADYAGFGYRRQLPGRARLRWEHEVKRVEDDIPNPTFQYRLIEGGTDVEGRYESVFVEDGLAMRHSVVNRGYVGTRLTPVHGLTLENNLRYEVNGQKADRFADGTGQESADLHTWALVNKGDYAFGWSGLTVHPMFRHTLLRQDMDGGTGPGGLAARRDVTEVVPILRADYQFTARTGIEVGAEGFPFLKERYIDRDNEMQDFRAQTYMGQLKRRGVSGGFNVFIIIGMQYTKKDFDEPGSPSGSFVRSFFQVFIGEEILAASQ